ncbi:MAG: class I SAM-dependent methyltransferase [Chloroflexota bacterium]|nr:class I SAM-dependent methyltransferase [Chloroflexota bacterium]
MTEGATSGPASPPAELAGERERIASYYVWRAEAKLGDRYSAFNPGHLFRVQRTDRAMLAALKRHGFQRLPVFDILDVGCGDGRLLRRLIDWGADRTRLHGIELLPERVAAAHCADPGLDVRQGDASALPFADASFDLVFQTTVFSTIVAEAMRRAVAADMARVLRSGGAVVSYDLRVARDRRHTRGIGATDLRRLFPEFSVDARRVTLIPPLARTLARWSWLACELLEEIPLLRTHELVMLRKP